VLQRRALNSTAIVTEFLNTPTGTCRHCEEPRDEAISTLHERLRLPRPPKASGSQ
jgi:hypothetical protein